MPVDVLDEMEQLQVLGGESTEDVHVNVKESCVTYTYCAHANCVAGCGSNSEHEEDPGRNP